MLYRIATSIADFSMGESCVSRPKESLGLYERSTEPDK